MGLVMGITVKKLTLERKKYNEQFNIYHHALHGLIPNLYNNDSSKSTNHRLRSNC